MTVILVYLLPVLFIFGWTYADMRTPRQRPLRVADLNGSFVPRGVALKLNHTIHPCDSAVVRVWSVNNPHEKAN